MILFLILIKKIHYLIITYLLILGELFDSFRNNELNYQIPLE